MLRRLSVEAARSYPRTAGLEDRFLTLAPDLLEGVTGADLAAAYGRAAAPRPVPMVELAHIHSVKSTVVDAVEELLDELPRVGRITFRALTEQLVDRLEIVVRFLAVLELYKQGMIDLEQARSFGDIEIRWLGADGERGADLASIDAYEG